MIAVTQTARTREAHAAGTPLVIDDTSARATYETVGREFAGWFQFQPIWKRISKDHPDIWD